MVLEREEGQMTPLAQLARDGYARLGRVASDEVLEALRTRAEEVMLGRVTYPGLFFQIDTESGNYDDLTYGKGYQGPSLNYRKIEKLEQDPLVGAWLDNPLFERVARARIEGEVAIYRAVLFSKARRGGTHLPWHQDGGRFWGLDRDPELQIWTALDDAPIDAGCMEIIPGSHLRGLATPLGGVVPANILAAHAGDVAVPLPASAGEVILVHNHAWHRSGVNTTDRPRRAFTVCYMSAATRCLRKKREPRRFHRVFTRAP
jgi:phytanoyl-CoA hydroxylase